ncbi:stage VI sporulation protein F [Paenibacillus alkalitolerans]|uniref:stage VI sporulation protein F n=1 Tax=Paenibacillus alkalitolerans TaxID=2799335 RepID=UPI0018F624EA|nr:stage VI sporulation protein F [Paenibacillus alkalitolerans]
MPGYEKYGISVELVERVKAKMKDPVVKERVKTVLNNVTKVDLQDRAKVRKLLGLTSKALGEKLSEQQADNVVRFVLAQKIDPNNALHLIKLWNMFR